MRSERRVEAFDPAGSPIGLALLVPGLTHWAWNQKERAVMIGGGFWSCLTLAALGWGSTLGLFMLLGAFGIHAIAMRDVLRQALFPGMGRAVPTLVSAGVVGLCCYLPGLLIASSLAWPGRTPDGSAGYLVNRWAFSRTEPTSGDNVWLRDREPRRPRIAQVIATSGQEIEWVNQELRIGGEPHAFKPYNSADAPTELAFKVPEGHVLVGFGREASQDERWRLVARSDIQGRAWAKLSPLWNRRWL